MSSPYSSQPVRSLETSLPRRSRRRILSRPLASLLVPAVLAASFVQGTTPSARADVSATETGGVLNVTLGAAGDTSTIATNSSDTDFKLFGTGEALSDFSGVNQLNVTAGFSNQVVVLDATNFSFGPLVNLTGGGTTDTLIKAGNNTVLLIGAVTLGQTNVNGGTLDVGDGGTTGSITGNVNISSSSANLSFDRSNALTFGGIITGAGSVTQAGSGALTLTGTNNFSGGIFVEGGVVSVSNAQALGTGHVTIDFGGELSTTGTVTIAKEADFASGVGKVSTSGTLTLNSVNIVGASTMTVGSAGHTGTVVIGNGGMLASTNSNIDVAFGTLANGGGLGALTFSANTTEIEAGAKLDLRDGNIEIGFLAGAGSITTGTKASTVLTLDTGSYGGVISGAGQVVITGSVVQLTGANTYTGGTTITPTGSLNIGDNLTGSIVGKITNNGTLTFQLLHATTSAGTISGTGMVRNDGGVLTLSGNNTYQGGTEVIEGTVVATNSNALGTGMITLDSATELSATGTVALSNNNQVNITAGKGTLSTSGTLTVNSLYLVGSLVVGSPGHTGTVFIGGDGTQTVGGGNTIEVAFGTLANATAGGMGVFTDFATSTTVDAGAKLDLRDGSIEVKQLSGSGSVILGTNAATTLTLDGAGFDGTISGAGHVIVNGLAFLAGANTYTGNTTITPNGQLFVGNGPAGSLVGNIVDNGALTFDRSGYTFAGEINGTGSVATIGKVTLSGSNSYAGTTTVKTDASNIGVLTITNANALGAGRVTLEDGAELVSTGSSINLTNTVWLNGAGTISTTGTLFLDNLVVVTKLTVGSQGHAGSVLLAIGGTESIAQLGTIDVAFGTLGNGGSLNYFTSTAASTTVEAGATLDLRNEGNLEIKRLLGAGSVKLGTLAATTLTIDGGDFAGVISGTGQVVNTGTLFLAGANTYTGLTTVSSGQLIIGNPLGTAGSIVGDVLNNGMLSFFHNGYNYAGKISGSGVVTVDGTSLTLSGTNNTYTGGTLIESGVVTITNANALGTGEVDVQDSTELTTTGNFTLANLVKPGAGKISTTGTLSLTRLNLDNSSRLVLGSSGHAGTVILAAGPAGISGGATIDVAFGTLANGGGMSAFTGAVSSTTVEAGATMDLRDGNVEVRNLQGAGSVKLGTLAATTLKLDAGTFNGVISGAGQVNINGNIFLNGANTYTGSTTVSAGNLTIGNGTTGSVAGKIVDNATVTFFRNNNYTFAGIISGSGSVSVTGTSLTLSGNNTYAGGTTLSNNLLTITNANALGTGAVLMNNSTQLTTTGNFTLTNPITPISNGTISTTGTLTLTSVTLINGSELFIGSSGHLGTVILGTGGTDSTTAVTGISVDFGTLANGGGLNTFTSVSNSTLVQPNGTLDLRDGNIEIKNLGGSGAIKLGTKASTTLTLDAAGLFGGVISGAGQVNATGNVTLTGANTYTGGTTAGNLHIGNGGTTGSIVGPVTINGTLTFNRSNALAFAGNMSGGGSLDKQGAGLLTLTGNSSFQGGTTIEGGTISMGNANALGTGSINLDFLSELTTTGSFTLPNTVATTNGTATVSTTGTLTLGSLALGAPIIFGSTGHTGTVVVSKTGSFTGVAGGVIEVAFGTLRNGNSLGTFTSFVNYTDVEAAGTLDVNDQPMTVNYLQGTGKVTLGKSAATVLTLNAGNFSGVISGAGAVNSAGNVTLSGASTYTGGTTVGAGMFIANNKSGSATGTGGVIVNGGTLGGTGRISGPVTLANNGVGQIFPSEATQLTAGSVLHAGSLLWNGNNAVSFDIGSVADELVLSGALTKGAGTEFDLNIFNVGIGLTPKSFTLMTFTSTTFSLSDFHLELPANVTGTLVLTPTSLQIQNLVDPPAELAGIGHTAAAEISEGDAISPAGTPDGTGAETAGLPTDPAGASTFTTGPLGSGDLSGTGETVAITPTPEPASTLLLAFGALSLLGRRRRK